jgi:hypothetical protein
MRKPAKCCGIAALTQPTSAVFQGFDTPKQQSESRLWVAKRNLILQALRLFDAAWQYLLGYAGI